MRVDIDRTGAFGLMTTLSVSSLAQSLGEVPPDNIIFGHSEVMQAVRSRLGKVAAANVPVLITGESGTGKDIIARLIHGLSPWKLGPYVKVNCPAIPGTLLESELFGYERGAFTGAVGSKPGRVELAHRGTLFLDEISELDPSLQSKLLQLLQDGQFCRIGAQEDKKVEVRVVCATNRHLEAEIESGAFRQDLYYRINVVNLRMPALRERRAILKICAATSLNTTTTSSTAGHGLYRMKCWRCCRNITGREIFANWKT